MRVRPLVMGIRVRRLVVRDGVRVGGSVCRRNLNDLSVCAVRLYLFLFYLFFFLCCVSVSFSLCLV